MKKFFVSALTVLNFLFISAQETTNVSYTPTNGATEATVAESRPIEIQAEATNSENVAKPSDQQLISQATTSSSSSSSDDFDSDYFASSNDAEPGDVDYKNVVGIRFGFNTSKVTSYGAYSSHLLGFNIGAVDQIWFGERAVFVETGIFYTLKGYKLLNFEPSQTKLHYIEFPTMICYRQGRSSLSMTYKAGGYLACGVKGTLNTYISDSPAALDLFKTEHEYDVFKEGAIGRFDAGARFGVDFSVRKVLIGFTYDLGLYKIDKNDIIYGDNELMLGYKVLKNRSFQIGLGFNF